MRKFRLVETEEKKKIEREKEISVPMNCDHGLYH